MSSPFTFTLRRVLLAFVCVAPLAAQAQTPAPLSPAIASPAVRADNLPPAEVSGSTRAEGRRNQKIENIHVEDGGAKVDEKRYGGQTQSISVQPRANVPGYQVLPNDGGRDRDGSAETSSGGNGPRVWNVMKF